MHSLGRIQKYDEKLCAKVKREKWLQGSYCDGQKTPAWSSYSRRLRPFGSYNKELAVYCTKNLETSAFEGNID